MNIKNLTDRRQVAVLLRIPFKKLTWVIFGPQKATYYSSWQVSKRNGRGVREIRAPRSTLYLIQKRLHLILQEEYRPRNPTNGFVLGRNVVRNASPHVGRRWVLNCDLVDFFPTINFGRVRGLFLSPPFNCPADVATLLAQICCWEGSLPIGAPTSPVISNMICLRMDRELQDLARRRGCRYTRYADDLTFSTDRATFSPAIVASVSGDNVELGSELTAILRGNGFGPNSGKTRLRPNHERQSVTGIIVNERLNLDQRDIRRIRAMLHSWDKFKLAGAQAHFVAHDGKDRSHGAKPDFRNVLWGHISYLALVRGSGDTFVQLFTKQFKNLAAGKPLNSEIEREAFPRPLPVPARPEERVLTIMFTDIVKSTPTAVSKGDTAWRELLDRHNKIVLALLSGHGGHPAERTGDGFVATFDSPRAAVSCGLAITASVKQLGIDVRVGIHTSTVMASREGLKGVGVHFAERVCGRAGAGEVLVSQAVADIEMGSDATFEDVGLRALKGFEKRRHLYRVRAS